MELIRIHEDKLKVVLTRGDMAELGLSHDGIDSSDAATRRSLISLLERGKAEVGFNPKRARLYIEVYPGEDGGCVLYYTRLRGSAAFPRGRMEPGPYPVVFAFEEVEHLIEACRRAARQYGHRIYKSSLYKMDSEHRLVVYPLDYSDRLSIHFLSEYGRLVGEGEIVAAFCEEHGELISAGDAIDRLSQAMG